MTVTETRADLSTADLNDLPDSAFAYIEPGGTKDDDGRTVPRSKRHFAIHDAAHVRNALSRIGQGAKFGDQALPKVKAAAKKFGVEVSEDKSDARDLERRRRRGSMIRKLERRKMPFARGGVEVRAQPDGTGGTAYVFEGYGSVFDTPFTMWDPWGDPYEEIVCQGAFSRTLAAQPDVPFLIGHNDGDIPLARTRSGTMTLAQDTHGLHVEARMDGRSGRVRDLASAVERGDMDEMSIGFVTMLHQWSPDWERRSMLDLELDRGDVSAVALAASPSTAGSTMTPFPVTEAARARRPAEQRTPTQPYTAHPGETNECVQCHSVNDDTAAYCDQCGTAMRPAGSVSNMQGVEDMTQRCGCGCWCSADAKFCGQCGQELTSAAVGVMYWSAGQPGEQRAADEIVDNGGPPDSNVAANGVTQAKCPYTKANSCGKMNSGDSKFCSGCGGPLYQSDGTLVVDDSGVVEALEGDKSDAQLLSMRLRMLELTARR